MPNFTKQAIKAAFLKLLNEMPLNKISVRSIVEECGINRNSFYYHYQDIPALIEEIAKDEIDSIIAKYPTINTIDECLNLAFRFAVENKRAVLHIYNSISRDIYVRNLMDICEYVVRTYLDTAFGTDAVSEYDRSVTVRLLKCEIYGLCVDWVSNGMKDDAIKEISHVTELCRGLSAELSRRSRELNKR